MFGGVTVLLIIKADELHYALFNSIVSDKIVTDALLTRALMDDQMDATVVICINLFDHSPAKNTPTFLTLF